MKLQLFFFILSLIYLYFRFQSTEQFQKNFDLMLEHLQRKFMGQNKIRDQQLREEFDYPQQKQNMTDQIQQSLENYKENTQEIDLRALLVPHASWAFSSEIMSEGFSFLKPKKSQTVFILAPSHNVLREGCALSNFDAYETTYGQTKVNKSLVNHLSNEFVFSKISEEEELQEHSVEIILPYLQYIYEKAGYELDIVPLYCLMNKPQSRQYYGQKLSKYLDNDDYFFILSSDLSHWGKKYGNNEVLQGFDNINDQVRNFDQMAMKEISFQDPVYFSNFIKKYPNLQICGASIIDIILNSIFYSPNTLQYQTQFLQYQQSREIKDTDNDFTFGMSSALITKKIKQ